MNTVRQSQDRNMYNWIRVARAARIARPLGTLGYRQVQGCLRGLGSPETARYSCAKDGRTRTGEILERFGSTLVFKVRAAMPRADRYIVSKVRSKLSPLGRYVAKDELRFSEVGEPVRLVDRRRSCGTMVRETFLRSSIRVLYRRGWILILSPVAVVKFKDVSGE